MKFSSVLTLAAAYGTVANGLSIPSDVKDIAVRSADEVTNFFEERSEDLYQLYKRKGGGGRGGGSSGGSSGGRSSGSSGSSSSGTSRSSNAGGTSSSGSGARPSYGGGRFYGGGATVPYTAGKRSPAGIYPFILPITALAFFPGLWLYSVYAYDYPNDFTFTNMSLANSSFPNGVNQTRPVQCLCQMYDVCGCDENDDSTYINSIIGNGSYAALNKTLVTVADANNTGTQTIFINGTLPNGTTAAGTSGAAGVGMTWAGWGVMGAAAFYATLMM